MTEKLLGKITSAEFGQVKGNEYLFGLQLKGRDYHRMHALQMQSVIM